MKRIIVFIVLLLTLCCASCIPRKAIYLKNNQASWKIAVEGRDLAFFYQGPAGDWIESNRVFQPWEAN